MADPRSEKGLRKLQLWISPELSQRMDVARDGRPIQTYVARLIEKAVALDEAERRSTAGELRKRHRTLEADSPVAVGLRGAAKLREEE